MKRVFNNKQKIYMLFWLIFANLLGWYFSIIPDKLIEHFLLVNFTVLMLMMVPHIFLDIIFRNNLELVNRLKETNAFYSLSTNYYWVIMVPVYNWIVAFFVYLLQLKYTNIYIDLLVVSNITILVLLSYYAVSRSWRIFKYCIKYGVDYNPTKRL